MHVLDLDVAQAHLILRITLSILHSTLLSIHLITSKPGEGIHISRSTERSGDWALAAENTNKLVASVGLGSEPSNHLF